MLIDLTPFYISSIVPPLVQNASRFNLRYSNDTQTVASRTILFYNSFLPLSIRDWHRLNPDIRHSGTLDAFKHKTKSKLACYTKTLLNTKYGTQKFVQIVAHLKLLIPKILLTLHYVLSIQEKLRMYTISSLFFNYTIILG